MKKFCLAIASMYFLAFAPLSVTADTVTFAELEAVTSTGASSYATTFTGPASITGVVINNPADMLGVTAGTPWQVYIQSVGASDHGGAALYVYSITAEELASFDVSYGDIITVAFNKVRGYNGKCNITTAHTTATQFTISVIGSTTPKAANITLAALKDSSDNFIFDSTRATGCEYYQGSLVHLTGLRVIGGSWTSGGCVTVEDAAGLTFALQLGLDSDLFVDTAKKIASSTFSITAILDQEDNDSDGDAVYNNGYRLWLTDASLLTVPEPSMLTLLTSGGLAALLLWRRRRVRAAV